MAALNHYPSLPIGLDSRLGKAASWAFSLFVHYLFHLRFNLLVAGWNLEDRPWNGLAGEVVRLGAHLHQCNVCRRLGSRRAPCRRCRARRRLICRLRLLAAECANERTAQGGTGDAEPAALSSRSILGGVGCYLSSHRAAAWCLVGSAAGRRAWLRLDPGSRASHADNLNQARSLNFGQFLSHRGKGIACARF